MYTSIREPEQYLRLASVRPVNVYRVDADCGYGFLPVAEEPRIVRCRCKEEMGDPVQFPADLTRPMKDGR